MAFFIHVLTVNNCLLVNNCQDLSVLIYECALHWAVIKYLYLNMFLSFQLFHAD